VWNIYEPLDTVFFRRSLPRNVLLYRARVWANAVKVAYRRIELKKIQRRTALSCVCAYRTISTETVCILARTPPIDLLVEERAKKEVRSKNGVLRVEKEARNALIEKWKDRISCTEKGDWTRMLICDLERWLSRSHGQMSFHLTQVLSGHGYFNEYLHRRRIKVGPECSHCAHRRNDGPQNTFFECEVWQCQRDKLVRSLGKISGSDYTEVCCSMGPGV